MPASRPFLFFAGTWKLLDQALLADLGPFWGIHRSAGFLALLLGSFIRHLRAFGQGSIGHGHAWVEEASLASIPTPASTEWSTLGAGGGARPPPA